MGENTFYDIHCHALTLQDPAFLALIQTLRSRKLETIYTQITSFEYLSSSFLHKGGEKLRNMLSVMENEPGDIFMLMEDDLKGKYGKSEKELPLVRDGRLHMGEMSYDKIVLVPLLMDFSWGFGYTTDTYYDKYPIKKIETQIYKVLDGIKAYRNVRPRGMLEILPFLGVSPQNHTAKSLRNILERWFSGYSGTRESAAGVFSGMKNAKIGEPGPGHSPFAGIKLYPPLGFDPWPEDGKRRAVAEVLYAFCCEKSIPITTHCDDGGFRLIPLEKSWKFSSPGRFRPALEKHPKLKLNFAHLGHTYSLPFGVSHLTNWRADIFTLMEEFPGVYGDFSFDGTNPDYYEGLMRALEALPEASRDIVRRRILFGSDFMVNLVKVRSYADYYRQFFESAFDAATKDGFVSGNPEKFLFTA